MHLTPVRRATLPIDWSGRRPMVHPILDAAGARGPVPGAPEERPMPAVQALGPVGGFAPRTHGEPGPLSSGEMPPWHGHALD